MVLLVSTAFIYEVIGRIVLMYQDELYTCVYENVYHSSLRRICVGL